MNSLVLKLGGSVLYDENLKLNLEFLKKVVLWFENQRNYDNVFFVVGGGKLSRFLVNQVKDEIQFDSLKHQIGIKVTHTNAKIFLALFNDKEIKYFDSLLDVFPNVKAGVLGGIMEGWSTDMVAANVAYNLGVKNVCKISDIDYIYTADPNIEQDAKPLETITWKEYIQLFHEQIGEKHKPGMSAPVDIECSLFCNEKGISFRVSGGDLNRDLDEILKTGTLVS